MKRVFCFALLLCAMISQAAVKIPHTVIPYNVNYHWGIIDVMIAHGTVSIESDGTNFHGTLDGTSIPWEGRVILVSDTLRTSMEPGGPDGLSKEIVNYQAGWYRRPKVNYFRSKDYDAGNPDFFRNIAGQGQYSASDDTMEAITVTSDMIGMFYYAQELDFESLHQGQKITIPIEGKFAQEVIVTYLGTGNYSVEDDSYPTYNIQFEYNYRGKLSGYQVQMKIGQKDKLPLFISASLPVGRVEMLYNP